MKTRNQSLPRPSDTQVQEPGLPDCGRRRWITGLVSAAAAIRVPWAGAAEPTDVEEVRIGYFGPSHPDHPQGGDAWLAATAAIDRANRQGGYQGRPFRLIPGWSDNPWGTGVRQVSRLVYQHHVWAIIGGIDGPSTHLAEQVAAKARLTLINPAATDKSINLANVSWMFSLVPSDDRAANVLAAAIVDDRKAAAGDRSTGARLVFLAADDHDSRMFALELTRCLSKRRASADFRFSVNAGRVDFEELSGRVLETDAAAAIVVASAEQSGQLIAALRKRGFAGRVYGGPSLGRRSFFERNEESTDNVVFPLLYQSSRASRDFDSMFHDRFGRQPDFTAAHAYDAVRLLVAAIRRAGLDRAAIRDAVAELSPWSGVTGTIRWTPVRGNAAAVRLGEIRRGVPAAL